MGKTERSWELELKRCWALFECIGAKSPKWLELNNACAPVPESSHLVQEDVFKANVKVQQVASYRRDSEGFLVWLAATPWNLVVLTPLQIAPFLREKRMQSKSAPSRALRALRWLSNCTGISMPLDDKQVVSQATVDKSKGKPELAVPAKTPTFAMLADMERMVEEAPTKMLQCVAGFVCLMAHAIVREHDAQHTDQATLTADSIMCRSYDTEQKRSMTFYAAPRQGVSKRDWPPAWLAVMEEFGLPGSDFLLLAPNVSFTAFTNRVAVFSDIQAGYRLLLQTTGMPAEESLNSSLHGWRHLLPTAARQLRFGVNDINEAAHWDQNSSMAQRYD